MANPHVEYDSATLYESWAPFDGTLVVPPVVLAQARSYTVAAQPRSYTVEAQAR